MRAFKELLGTSKDAAAFQKAVAEHFDVWQSRGYDDKGTVLFTGYFSPEIKASMTRTDTFRFPLYQAPTDLVKDSQTGEPLAISTPTTLRAPRIPNLVGPVFEYVRGDRTTVVGLLNDTGNDRLMLNWAISDASVCRKP